MANSRYVPRKQDGMTYEIYMILLSAEEPMTSYEVFQLVPDMEKVVYSGDVMRTLKRMVRRGQIKRIKTLGGSKYCLIR